MQQERSATRMTVAAMLLLGGVVWLSGCGSSGAGKMATGGQLQGTVSAPTAQLALGSTTAATQTTTPVTATGENNAVNRKPVSGGAVTLSRLSDQATVASTTTDANGHFAFNGVPTGTAYLVSVTAQGAAGPLSLRCVTVPDGTQAPITVNEVTTVGAEAALIAVTECGDTETAVQCASEVTESQECIETENPEQIPDLCKPESVNECAEEHLVANLDGKLWKLFASPKDEKAAWRVFMAAQVYAHETLGLPSYIRLTRRQVLALCRITTECKTFTLDEIVCALQCAGVPNVSCEAVRNSLIALKQRPKLNSAFSCICEDGPVPPIVALLLAEQVKAADAAGDCPCLAIRTQKELDIFVCELTESASATESNHHKKDCIKKKRK